ncbi:MAG: Ig-like domain-containing protein [Treponema sp.]|jgi:hypothetical protein|nr:Ig-like domain-containing protein [Treponema sp.]
MNHKTSSFFPLLIPLLMGSCDLLRDSSFEVEGWTPGNGYHSSPENILVSVLFSHDPDRTGTEKAFSLSEDGLGLAGSISWEGRRLFFTPTAPLEADRNYLITVLPDASDTEGVSLEKKFEAPFTTRPESARPKLVSIAPADEGILPPGRDRVELGFSEPIALNSCVDFISLSPSQAGSWQLGADEKTAIFTPAEPWITGTRYRLNVSSLFSGKTGLTMGEDFFSHFTVGFDAVPPILTGAYGLDPLGGAEQLIPETLGTAAENVRWEGDTRLRLDFSEPVSTASLIKCLEVEPGPSLVLETPPGFAASLVFRFSERPAYGSRFFIRLNSGVLDSGENTSAETYIFRIYADGPGSKPPAFVGIRLPVAPWKLNGSGKDELNFPLDQPFAVLPLTHDMGEVDYGIGKPAWVELYFDTAEGASPDLFSVRELFRVEATNNALSFSPRSVVGEGFSSPDPPPEWMAYKRVEVRGELTDTTNSGVVSFSLASGLVDTRGNRNEKAFRLPLLK